MIRALHARPLGITALIIFFVLGTLISFFAGLSLLFPSAFFNGIWRLNPHGHEGLLSIGLWAVVLLFAASACCSAAAVGLWKAPRLVCRFFLRHCTVDLLALLQADTLDDPCPRRLADCSRWYRTLSR